MSRKTRRKIANLRADECRRDRASFKWLPVRWATTGGLWAWTFVCAAVCVAAAAGAQPGIVAHYWIGALTWPIWFAAPILLDRATRPLLGRHLLGEYRSAMFNFHELWEQARGKGTKSARKELRNLCEQGTLLELDCLDKGVSLGETEVWKALNRLYDRAKELSEAIIEFEDNKLEDSKVVEARLKQRLRDEARQIERDHIAQQALAQLREENELAEREARLGITSTAQDVIDELRGATAGNQEIAAIQQPI